MSVDDVISLNFSNHFIHTNSSSESYSAACSFEPLMLKRGILYTVNSSLASKDILLYYL